MGGAAQATADVGGAAPGWVGAVCAGPSPGIAPEGSRATSPTQEHADRAEEADAGMEEAAPGRVGAVWGESRPGGDVPRPERVEPAVEDAGEVGEPRGGASGGADAG